MSATTVDTLPEPPAVTPPEMLGAAGVVMRDRAVAALTVRFLELSDRAKRRQLTEPERSELDRLGVIIDTLQGMAVATAG